MYKTLRALKVKKSPGPELIPNIVWKEFAFELAPVLADIYNSSLQQGYVPTHSHCIISFDLQLIGQHQNKRFTSQKSFRRSGSQTLFSGGREATTRNASAVRRLIFT